MGEQQGTNAEGIFEKLSAQAEKLLQQSKEKNFTEYLLKFRARLFNQKYQIDLLQDELDRSYQLYLNRIETQQDTEPSHTATPQMETIQPQQYQRADQPQQSPVQPLPPVQPAQPLQQPVTTTRKSNPEFTFAVVIFSVIGVFFILSAFVILGMNFMNGFVKGMSLYAICLILLLVSELILRKKNSKLNMTLTTIGICGLYLATVINNIQLHNFNTLIAVIITTLISAGTLFLSYKRDSWLLRIGGIFVCYLCLLIFQNSSHESEIFIIAAVLTLINIIYVFIPIQKAQIAIGTIHMLGSTFFNLIFLVRLFFINEMVNGYKVAFLFLGFFILHLIFVKVIQEGYKKKEAREYFDITGILIAYSFSVGFYLLAINRFGYSLKPEFLWIRHEFLWLRHINTIGLLTICLLFFIVMFKKKEKWILYYIANVIVLTVYASIFSNYNNLLEGVICIVGMLVFSKLLTKIHELRYSEGIIFAIACIYTISIFTLNNNVVSVNKYYIYLLPACIIISTIFLHRWQTYYEIVTIFTLVVLLSLKLPYQLELPVIVGILFIAILAFNNVKRWRGKGIIIFNIGALLGQIICYLYLMEPIYKNEYLVYAMMLVFGLATITLTFQKKYQMDFSAKELIMALFLTYMAFACRTGIPILTSVLLMIIALISVGSGFVINKKSVRIYGLVLSLFVCIKIVLYDFWDIPTIQKMILFFVVGFIALIIAGIYIVLEKKYYIKEQNSTFGENV